MKRRDVFKFAAVGAALPVVALSKESAEKINDWSEPPLHVVKGSELLATFSSPVTCLHVYNDCLMVGLQNGEVHAVQYPEPPLADYTAHSGWPVPRLFIR